MQKQPAKKPLGRMIERTDADLERISQVTQDDMDQALAECEADTRALLEATEEDVTP